MQLFPGKVRHAPRCKYCADAVSATLSRGKYFKKWNTTCGSPACISQGKLTALKAHKTKVDHRLQTPPKCKYCVDYTRPRYSKAGKFTGWSSTCMSPDCRFKITGGAARLRVVTPRVCKHCSTEFIPKQGKPRKWCETCAGSRRGSQLLSKYGVTEGEVDALLRKQGGVCALCPAPATAVDHCHRTGVVRGMLCRLCNICMAAVDRDYNWAARAQAYRAAADSVDHSLAELTVLAAH